MKKKNPPTVGPAPKPKAATGFARPTFQKKVETDYPKLPALIAIAYVAVTVIIMAYSGLFGIYPILLLYGMWFSRGYYKGRIIIRPTRDIRPALALGLYCVISFIWSNYPEVAVHNGLEYLSMILCSIIMARIVTIECFVKGLALGATLVLMVTFSHGFYDPEGLFGSKNQVGLFAEIGILASVLYGFSNNTRVSKLFFAVGPGLICSMFLYLAHSGTSLVTLILILGLCYTAWHITRFSPARRKAVLTAVIVFGAVVAIAGFYFGSQDTLLQMMGKDATLTGRTYLWGEGIKVGLQHPIFGHGYGGFWVPGQPEAERYWFEFDIFNRTGFHFHSLLVQTFVDLGAIGLLLMLSIIFSNCIKSFRSVIENGANLTSITCLGISFLFLSRTFVEVDYLGPFGIGVLLFFSMPPRLASLNTFKTGLVKPPKKQQHIMRPPAPGMA